MYGIYWKNDQNAHRNALGGVQKLNTTSHACSSVKNVVQSACVFHQATMATKLPVLVIKIGRPRGEVQNALN